MANAVSTNGLDDGGGGGGSSGGMRPARLPRWTRQEILVLIQGKKMAESRGRGRSRLHQMGSSSTASAPLVGVGTPVEPKWATVSSYCRRHGVNRGPVQCRKRWSNLAGDFKKIKEWELRRAEGGRGATESFWSMRNDLRRERRLPGFFDREVYNILDGAVEVGGEPEDTGRKAEEVAQQPLAVVAVEDEEEDEPVFDSGRAAAEDGLFSDSEGDDDGDDDEKQAAAPPPSSPSPAAPVTAATPISERKADDMRDPSSCDPSRSGQATSREKQPVENPEERPATPREANKRKRSEQEEPQELTFEDRLVDILERNGRMLHAQLEAQNHNSQLDRDLRREQTNSVVHVLSKLVDVLGRLADRL